MTLAGRVSPFGHPRINAWLPTPLGFSQVTDVLHRLLTPRHSPYALISLIASTRRHHHAWLRPCGPNQKDPRTKEDTPCRRTISPDNRRSDECRNSGSSFRSVEIMFLDVFLLFLFVIADRARPRKTRPEQIGLLHTTRLDRDNTTWVVKESEVRLNEPPAPHKRNCDADR